MSGGRPPRKRVALVIFAIALVAVGIRFGPGAWWTLTHRRTAGEAEHEGHRIYITADANRFTGAGDGRVAAWYIDTGRLAFEQFLEGGMVQESTRWHRDGTVEEQERNGATGGGTVLREEPPWWDDVQPQVTPTAPWVLDGVPYEEWPGRP